MLHIKAIIDSLLAISDPVIEQDHIDAILEGLLEEYNSFVMMIYRRIDPPSTTDIEALLMVQEAQLEKFKQELTGSVVVNVAHGPNSRQSDSSDYTKAYSNSENNQNYRRGSRGRGRGCGHGGNRPTCQLCNKYGHDAYNFWHRFD